MCGQRAMTSWVHHPMPSSGAGGGTGSLFMHHLTLRLHGSNDGAEHDCDKVPIPVGVAVGDKVPIPVGVVGEPLNSQAGSTR